MRIELGGYKLILNGEMFFPLPNRAEMRRLREDCRIRLTVTHVRRRYEVDSNAPCWYGWRGVKWCVFDRDDHDSWLAPVNDHLFLTPKRALKYARNLNRRERLMA